AGYARTLAATAPDVAAELLELAMELAGPADPQWPALAADRAGALLWSGRWSDAERLAQASLDAGADGSVAERMLLTRAHALVARGQPAEALVVATAGAAAALSGGVHAHALALAACSRLALGDRRQAVVTAERARREAADAGDGVAVCFALHVLILGYGLAGQFARAVALAEESERLADSERSGAGHRFAAYVVRSGFLIHLDRLAESNRVLTAGRLLAERLGDRQILPFCNSARALVCFVAGDWPAADAELEIGIAAARAMGSGFLRGPLNLRALLAVHRGDLAATREALIGANQAAGRGGVVPFSEFGALATALLREAEGRPDLAWSALMAGWDSATASGTMASLPALAVDYVRLALAHGDQRRARAALEAIDVLADSHPDAYTLQGTMLRCRGLLDNDVDALLAAVDVQRAGPRPLERALACGEAAAALARTGAHERAMVLLDEACAVLSALGARHDLMRVVTAARAAGLRPGRRPGRLTETGVGALTPAERAVAELVAEGLTNPEIGKRLYVSRNTVRTHVSRVLSKLGCRSRAEIAVAMVRNAGRAYPHS
ncbi:MAG: LuxR C-terminal-related transcriptional regulator, partial [Actinomycetota bacterium]|nr:LuxR C-terminal-related transcriptional regulator [Actinomycetota bacterium]